VAKSSERDDPVYGEDCVGYFIQPDPDTMLAYQVYINPAGAVYDAFIWVGDDGYANGDTDWNGKYEIKTNIGDGAWTMEARMPLDQMGVKLEQGKSIKLNFRRKHKRLSTAADWMAIDHHPDSYGILLLK
jgi:hypothetical protein